MKNRYIVLIVILLLFPLSINASSGAIKKNSVFDCNGILYGSHGDPLHYHLVKEVNGSYYALGDEVMPACAAPIKSSTFEIVTLSSCVDGDTAKFVFSDGSISSTRFLAIDTPETVKPNTPVQPYGKEASDYTCNQLTTAQEIKLEYDPGSDKYDKYNRVLAWVYVDGRLLQKELIEQGLGEVAYLYGDYLYTDILEDAENVAKINKVGKWSDSREVVQSFESSFKGFGEYIKSFFASIVDFIKKLFE